MSVYAVKKTGGGREELAARHGATIEEVVRKLTAQTLTGSAVPLDDVELETAAGGRIRYGDVARFEHDERFLA